MNPELLLIDKLRRPSNSADFLVIDKIAKAIFRVPGIGRVQAITRPYGKPVKFSTIPASMSLGGVGQDLNRKYLQDRMTDMLKQADEMQVTIDTMTRMSNLMGEMSATTHSMVEKTRNMTVDIAELRDYIANFDDFSPDPQRLHGNRTATTSISAGRCGLVFEQHSTASTRQPRPFRICFLTWSGSTR